MFKLNKKIILACWGLNIFYTQFILEKHYGETFFRIYKEGWLTGEIAFPWIAFASFYIITWTIIKVFCSLASFGPIWANSLKAVLP